MTPLDLAAREKTRANTAVQRARERLVAAEAEFRAASDAFRRISLAPAGDPIPTDTAWSAL
ncbi:hypothetical protein GMYAFLOJ_CDS0073 [Microbacterium phage phiMiGM15]